MTRVKRGFKARRRRKRVLEQASGFRGSRSRRFRTAIHVVRRAMSFAYRDRRVKSASFAVCGLFESMLLYVMPGSSTQSLSVA